MSALDGCCGWALAATGGRGDMGRSTWPHVFLFLSHRQPSGASGEVVI
jgi:hypothetical protein